MTSFGCFGPVNDIDGPPYDSVNFVFGLQQKVATASEFFFYSFTMNVTDGYGAYALTYSPIPAVPSFHTIPLTVPGPFCLPYSYFDQSAGEAFGSLGEQRFAKLHA